MLRRFVVLNEINSVASTYSYITKIPKLKKEEEKRKKKKKIIKRKKPKKNKKQ